MFKEAFSKAAQFTFPVIVSQRLANGTCSAGIGAYVLVNNDGWIVTAGHVLKQFVDLSTAADNYHSHAAREHVIRSDNSIDDKERRTRLKKLGHLMPTDVTHASALFANNQSSSGVLNAITLVDGVDLGITQLPNFRAAPNQIYPVFKDPTKGYEPGTSLCKLGYPFNSINPTFNDVTQGFELPHGTFPLPLFPIEGIFTRVANVQFQTASGSLQAPDPTLPLKWVETSSPGLKGQSGGPTFDRNGVVWAVQCQTYQYDLGFNSKTPQYFNVGMGVHMETVLNIFDRYGVKFQVSKD